MMNAFLILSIRDRNSIIIRSQLMREGWEVQTFPISAHMFRDMQLMMCRYRVNTLIEPSLYSLNGRQSVLSSTL